MDVSTAIRSRRSIKAFDPEHKMSTAEIAHLTTLALLSPTAFNIQNWRFVLVQDPELRRQLRAVAWDQAQVTDASLINYISCRCEILAKRALAATGKMFPKLLKRFFFPPLINITMDGNKYNAMKRCAHAGWRQ